MAIIDNAVYVNGARTENPTSLDDTFELMRERRGMAWIGLYRPTHEEIRAVAAEFDLHHLAVDDTLAGHQRAKLERYGDTVFLVLRPARYLDAEETVSIGELHVFVGSDFVVTVRHAESPDLAQVRARLEAEPEILSLGPKAVLYAVLDQVVDEYAPVVTGLENDIDEIEDQLFGRDPGVSRRIYALLREVIDLQRAVDPLPRLLDSLLVTERGEKLADDLLHRFRDVVDHAQRVTDRMRSLRAILQNALTVNSTLLAQQQNEEMKRLAEAGLMQNDESRRLSETSLAATEQTKRISSWAAILFAPTLVGTVYGMNFDYMPELHWVFGYPVAVASMFGMGLALYVAFKRKHWL